MSTRSVTAFRGHRQLAAGRLRDVARLVWRSLRESPPSTEPVLIFDDASGQVIDLEMRGDESDMLAHLDAVSRVRVDGRPDVAAVDGSAGNGGAALRPRGRPRLGVVAREVTLLPRHWEWLATQSGGASVALRRLVDEARRTHAGSDRAAFARDAAYRFLHAIAGDQEQFEEATRALYRDDITRLREILETWPHDVRDFAVRLLEQEASPHHPSESDK